MRVPAVFIPFLLPLASWWVRHEQRYIFRHGIPLNDAELSLAREMGVRNPAAIRLMFFEEIPARFGKSFYRLGRKLGVFFPQIAGLTLGHAIYIRRECWGNFPLLAHECVHTAQYERFGISGFLRRYFTECLTEGYLQSTLEREAVEKSSHIS